MNSRGVAMLSWVWFRTRAGVLVVDNDLTTCDAGTSSHMEGTTARKPINSAYGDGAVAPPPPSGRVVHT